MPEAGRVPFHIELKAFGQTIDADTSVPNARMRVADLLPILLTFDSAVVSLGADRAESEGKKISCRAGCGACCRQLVPISEAEALYLDELVAAMPAEEQAEVRARFEQAIEALGEDLIGRLRETSKLKEKDARREIGKEYFARKVPCPFLKDESCSIHPHRPMSCREYLVTSPAANCMAPGPDTIAPVPMPAQLSTILYCFADGEGKAPTRWIPLVLALEWAKCNRAAQPYYFGPELFGNFLKRVTEVMPGEE
jgi:Fe-S-cluster containining protein